MKYFNPEAFKPENLIITTAPSGFKYGFIPDIFPEGTYQELVRDFPELKLFKLVDKMSGGGRKRFFTGPAYDVNKTKGCICHFNRVPGRWDEVLIESASAEFMELLRTATGVEFNTVCVFGFNYGNEECRQDAHVDGAVREYDKTEYKSTLATLIYFNSTPDNTSGTCVYGTDRKTVLFQAPSMRNGMFFFEQHPDAWHGFPMMPPGKERRLVSLAYGQNDSPILVDDSFAHRIKCKYRYISFARKILGRNRSDKSY